PKWGLSSPPCSALFSAARASPCSGSDRASPPRPSPGARRKSRRLTPGSSSCADMRTSSAAVDRSVVVQDRQGEAGRRRQFRLAQRRVGRRVADGQQLLGGLLVRGELGHLLLVEPRQQRRLL